MNARCAGGSTAADRTPVRLCRVLVVLCALALAGTWGCAPAVVGAGAAGAVGAYSVGTDERTMGDQLDDTVLTSKIRTAMIANEELKSLTIDVDSIRGTAFLIGNVDSQRQYDLAGEVAGRVPGVRKVVNELMIGSISAWQRMEDAAVTTKIKTKLVGNEEVRALNVDVDTVNAVVFLTGVADSQAQVEVILGLVRSTAGVRAIRNLLVVGGRMDF